MWAMRPSRLLTAMAVALVACGGSAEITSPSGTAGPGADTPEEAVLELIETKRKARASAERPASNRLVGSKRSGCYVTSKSTGCRSRDSTTSSFTSWQTPTRSTEASRSPS